MSILSNSGRPMVMLGGENSWKQYTKGDVCLSFQWLKLDDEATPCMCLFPTGLRMDAGAYVIPQASLWKYVDNKGDPTNHLMISAVTAAHTLGLFPDKFTVQRIIDMIADGSQDLLKMPDWAPDHVQALMTPEKMGIEVQIKRNGEVFAEGLS
jgi:hypothetical protein